MTASEHEPYWPFPLVLSEASQPARERSSRSTHDTTHQRCNVGTRRWTSNKGRVIACGFVSTEASVAVDTHDQSFQMPLFNLSLCALCVFPCILCVFPSCCFFLILFGFSVSYLNLFPNWTNWFRRSVTNFVLVCIIRLRLQI